MVTGISLNRTSESLVRPANNRPHQTTAQLKCWDIANWWPNIFQPLIHLTAALSKPNSIEDLGIRASHAISCQPASSHDWYHLSYNHAHKFSTGATLLPVGRVECPIVSVGPAGDGIRFPKILKISHKIYHDENKNSKESTTLSKLFCPLFLYI